MWSNGQIVPTIKGVLPTLFTCLHLHGLPFEGHKGKPFGFILLTVMETGKVHGKLSGQMS